jgi:hypothetical protein
MSLMVSCAPAVVQISYSKYPHCGELEWYMDP